MIFVCMMVFETNMTNIVCGRIAFFSSPLRLVVIVKCKLFRLWKCRGVNGIVFGCCRRSIIVGEGGGSDVNPSIQACKHKLVFVTTLFLVFHSRSNINIFKKVAHLGKLCCRDDDTFFECGMKRVIVRTCSVITNTSI